MLSDITIPSNRSLKIELINALEEKVRRKKANLLIDQYSMWYDWQRKFCEYTKDKFETCLCAANQVGKTMSGTDIDAFHLTGEYPDDYPGHRFDFAPLCWGLGYSMEKTRDLLQTKLFGKYDRNTGFEGGLIPKDKIVSFESAGAVTNAMRTVRVKHKYGTSIIQFWSYTQGQHAIMGDVVDWVHVDEEPKDQTIRPQLLTRTINGDKQRGGRIIYTFTPENGRTELVIKFMDEPTSDQAFMKIGWRDAPHITPEKAKRLLEQYPEHQRKMRSEGEPMLGHGRIYDIADEFILCDPFEIPDHWLVIGGMDFGDDHPQAFAKLALDPDSDIIYVTNSWKKRRCSANDAWGATMHWTKGLPIAWPQDGLQKEKGRDDTVELKKHYIKAGFTLLPEFATWPEGGRSVETGLFQISDLQRKRKWRVFIGQQEYMEEHRNYHRSEPKSTGTNVINQIVKINDDIMDAARYAYMMRRYAKRKADIGMIIKPKLPQPVTPMGKR
jgi:phage terminase large subunit-like protein